MVFPNDVTNDNTGNIYATDTAGGTVWRIPNHGTPELWAADPLLEGTGAFGFGFPLGANGIAVDHKDVIVTDPEKAAVVLHRHSDEETEACCIALWAQTVFPLSGS